MSGDPATRPRREEQLPAEDDATEVAPGVVRIQLPILMPGLGHVNCYVLEDGDGVTLVDPGLPGPQAHADLVARLEVFRGFVAIERGALELTNRDQFKLDRFISNRPRMSIARRVARSAKRFAKRRLISIGWR